MCIICNLTDPPSQLDQAETFLYSFSRAQAEMGRAVEAMLAVSKLPLSPDNRKRYDRAHKQMVRVMRDWNKIEHSREHAQTPTPDQHRAH